MRRCLKNNNGFILSETLLAFSLTILIVISSAVLIAIMSTTLSSYSRLSRSKIFADSALDLIKDQLIFADSVKINTVDGYENFFKIRDGVLISEKGDLYGRENFSKYPMQIEMEARDFGLINLHVKILDKTSDVLYDAHRVFKINLLHKTGTEFIGPTGLITNPTIYYAKERAE